MGIEASSMAVTLPAVMSQQQMGFGAGARSASSGGVSSAAATGSAPSAGKVYDVKELNKDGVVSYEEELRFSMVHPEDVPSSQTAGLSAQGYDSRGQATDNPGEAQRAISIMA